MKEKSTNPFTAQDLSKLNWIDIGFNSILYPPINEQKKFVIGDWSNLEGVKLGTEHFDGHSFDSIAPTIQREYVKAKADYEHIKRRRTIGLCLGTPTLLALLLAPSIFPEALLQTPIGNFNSNTLFYSTLGGAVGGGFRHIYPSIKGAKKNLLTKVNNLIDKAHKFGDNSLKGDIEKYRSVTSSFKKATQRLTKKAVIAGIVGTVLVAPPIGLIFCASGLALKKVKTKKQNYKRQEMFEAIAFKASVQSIQRHLSHDYT